MAGTKGSKGLLTAEKLEEFKGLYSEFLIKYLKTEKGVNHDRLYKEGQSQAIKNYEDVTRLKQSGGDITDEVLHKFLPYKDGKTHRRQGVFIHVAPMMPNNVKGFFEANGWVKPDEWPKVSEAIYKLIDDCYKSRKTLDQACGEFNALKIKGLQSGYLTPFLNSLDPHRFQIINSKSLKIIEYFANRSYSAGLSDYPAANDTLSEIVREVEATIAPTVPPGGETSELLDMFSHWLVYEKKFFELQYWKIAPGVDAWNWESCKNDGYIGLWWGVTGDITDMKKAEFDKLCDRVITNDSKYKKQSLSQVWEFAHIPEGSIIVANKGTKKLLGFGKVIGEYYFVEGAEHAHRLPVEWYDTNKRDINEPGWTGWMMQKLDLAKIRELEKIPTIEDWGNGKHSNNLPKQIILYGPPGTGKTWRTKKMAVELILHG